MTVVWKSPATPIRTEIPTALRPLLLERGSLTRRLRRVLGNPIEVRVDRQGWAAPEPDEARLLGLAAGASALVREVTLLCRGRQQVAARTVIPRATLRGRHRRLARLGDRPLGDVLFATPGMSRGAMHIARLRAAAPVPATWGRRSVFFLDDRPLLVYEFFLRDAWP